MTTTRHILTSYYSQTNSSKDPDHKFYAGNLHNALSRAVYHMLRNEFGARYATVTDLNTGQLYAVYTFKPGEGFRIVLDPKTAQILTLMDPDGPTRKVA